MPLNTIWREEGFSYATSQATCRRRRRQIEFEQFARMVATPNINARHQRALDASQTLTIYGTSRAIAGALLASVTARAQEQPNATWRTTSLLFQLARRL